MAQIKELLGRGDIRTMKKDLQKLRELDVVQESNKIINAKAGQPSPAPLAAPSDAEALRQKIFLLQSKKTQLEEQIQKQSSATKSLHLENQKKDLEKKQWLLETQLKKLGEKILEVEGQDQKMNEQDLGAKSQIGHIDDQLGQLQAALQQKNPEAGGQAPAAPITEEQKRKKFMEDVEQWANTKEGN